MANGDQDPASSPEEDAEGEEALTRDSGAESGSNGLIAGVVAGAGIGAAVALGETSGHTRDGSGARTPTPAVPATEPGGTSAPSTTPPAGPAIPRTGDSTGRTPRPSASRDAGPAGGVPGTGGPPAPSGSGTNGLGRTLGIGAAAGLGGVAAAGLLGHAGSGQDLSPHPVHLVHQAFAPADPSDAPHVSAPGDQGYTPLDAQTALSPPGIDTSTAGSSGTDLTGPATQSSPFDGSSPDVPAHQPIDAGGSPAQPTVAGRTDSQPYDSANQPIGDGVSDLGASGQPPQSDSPSPVLYDGSGHPAGTLDPSGQFTPFSGTTPSPDASGKAPVLYDASGHPVATTGASGHVVPLSSTSSPPETTTGDDGTSAGQDRPPASQDPQTDDGPAQPATETSADEPTYAISYTYPEMTDEQRLYHDPLSLTPEQRYKLVRAQMTKAGLELPPVDAKDVPQLPDSFWQKDSYDFDGKQLSPVDAAATVYGLASAFTVNINELGILAGHMDALSQKMLGAWQKLYGRVGDLKLDDVFGDSEDLSDFHAQYTDTMTSHSAAALEVVNGLEDQAAGLRQTASSYVEEENANLAPFGVSAVDPRSAMDKAHYQDDEDMSKNYPDWYFDTRDYRSPFYKQS
jgi:hypothetical protein